MTVTHDAAVEGTGVAPPTLRGIDHVEWWVGNARAFAGFLSAAFGFQVVGYAGPETGRRDRVSHLLQQGSIRFVVTGALGPDSPIAAHVRVHGDGVHDVCLAVDDAEAAYSAAVALSSRLVGGLVDGVGHRGVLVGCGVACAL